MTYHSFNADTPLEQKTPSQLFDDVLKHGRFSNRVAKDMMQSAWADYYTYKCLTNELRPWRHLEVCVRDRVVAVVSMVKDHRTRCNPIALASLHRLNFLVVEACAQRIHLEPRWARCAQTAKKPLMMVSGF